MANDEVRGAEKTVTKEKIDVKNAQAKAAEAHAKDASAQAKEARQDAGYLKKNG